jgi:hypothetical protein
MDGELRPVCSPEPDLCATVGVGTGLGDADAEWLENGLVEGAAGIHVRHPDVDVIDV